MSSRTVARKTRSNVQSDQTTEPENTFTEFPASPGVFPATAQMTAPLQDSDDEAPARPIDVIADHVLAARYLSAEWQDTELNGLLDKVLLKIGRTIAGGTESFVVEAMTDDREAAVLKLVIRMNSWRSMLSVRTRARSWSE